MLIIISDLHCVDHGIDYFEDGESLLKKAFEGFFNDIRTYGKNPQEIKLLFLGDIFDINRSVHWLEAPPSERPWGENREAIERHANKVMDDIIAKNKEVFDLLKGPLKEEFGLCAEPERIFIPGNHDRLCNVFPSLRKKVRENLGISIPAQDTPFLNEYKDMAYGLFARHGHECDEISYENKPEQVAIGDVITTEIATRIPYTILKHLGDDFQNKKELQRNLEEIENIRPYSAMFDWVFYQVKEKKYIKRQISDALKEIAEGFENLEYVQKWYQRYDEVNINFDIADKLQNIIRLFKYLDIEHVEDLLNIYTKLFGSPDNIPLDDPGNALLKEAKRFFAADKNSGYPFYVMGHTHNPMQVPIGKSKGVEKIYLNSGTWRTRHVKGLSNGFVSWKNLTYLIFYQPRENGNQRLETWTGTLK